MPGTNASKMKYVGFGKGGRTVDTRILVHSFGLNIRSSGAHKIEMHLAALEQEDLAPESIYRRWPSLFSHFVS